MIKYFNGWQRLWLVVVAMYLVPVVFLTIDALPTASAYSTTRVLDTIEFAGRQMESSKPGYTFEGSHAVREKYYSDLTDEQIIERVHAKFKDRIDFSKIESEYKRRLDNLYAEQIKVVGSSLLWWIIPSALLYLFGVAVAWVIRGFRRDRP